MGKIEFKGIIDKICTCGSDTKIGIKAEKQYVPLKYQNDSNAEKENHTYNIVEEDKKPVCIEKNREYILSENINVTLGLNSKYRFVIENNVITSIELCNG